MFYRSIQGIHGDITIPGLNTTVGTMKQWTLTRREETHPESGEWTLRALLSYVNEFAFRSDAVEKRFSVWIGDPKHKGQQFVLEFRPRTNVQLAGSSLLVDGVNLIAAEPRRKG